MRLHFVWTGEGYIRTMQPWRSGKLVVYTEDDENARYPLEEFKFRRPASVEVPATLCKTAKPIGM